MPEIKQELIIRALELCGKTIEDMLINEFYSDGKNIYRREYMDRFSYPYFFYYLSSPEFLYKYNRHINYNIDDAIW